MNRNVFTGVYNDALSSLSMRTSFLFRKLSVRHMVLSLMFCFMAYPDAVVNTIEAAATPSVALLQSLKDLQDTWHKNQREYVKTQNRLHIKANAVRRQLCAEGEKEYCAPELQAKNVDLEKLAHAVAVAETADCTKGLGATKNNCHGIFGCVNGVCGPREFLSKEQSYQEFQKLWITKYGDRFPTIKDAQRYTYSDGKQWLHTVRVVYQQP